MRKMKKIIGYAILSVLFGGLFVGVVVGISVAAKLWWVGPLAGLIATVLVVIVFLALRLIYD